VTVDAGPCSSWTPYWASDVSTFSPVLTGYAVESATRFLWALSGRRFGTCQVTWRPCRKDCYDMWPGGSYAYPWSSYGAPLASAAWDFAYWFPFMCGGCNSDSCSCSYVSETILPAPVADVTQVLVDGAVLPSSSYRIDNTRILVRTDGQHWPRCNDLTKAATEVGTWSVTADVGLAVPISAQFAVGELAYEILKAATGDDSCGLPSTVTGLVRQGVSITFPDINELLTEGRTGLYLCDLFLAAENPNRLTARARVYNIDRPFVRRTDT
jgi:hypothetical protein